MHRVLFAIACKFKIAKDRPFIYGMAVCADPDTPITFIFPDGIAYKYDEIWSYELLHHRPWAMIDTAQGGQ